MAALALAAGCVSRQAADPLRLAGRAMGDAGAAVDWPVRRSPTTDGADEAKALSLLDPGDAYLEAIAPPPHHYPDERESIGAYGVGTLDRVDLDAVATDSARLERARRRNGLSEWLLFMSERTSIRPVSSLPIREPVPVRLPNWLRLIEPSITSLVLFKPEGQPRGIAIHLASLAGYVSYEMELVRALRSNGWLVLSTAIPSPRLTEEAVRVDLSTGSGTVGALLGSAVDERLAEWAYGVEAVYDYVLETHPGLAAAPLVGIGSSAGALSMPAVAARLGRPLDAVVLIGGGADVLEIVRHTSLPVPPVRLEWRDGREPDAAQWEQIDAAYEASTRLDPVNAIRFLRHTPMLMLQADWDTIVPATCGERLWELAGRPERWRYAAGHLGLFLFWLPQEKERIVEWLDRAAATSRDAAP